MMRTVLVVLVCGALLLSVGSSFAEEPPSRDHDDGGPGQILTVLVDETYCATGGTQCPDPTVGALPGNNNPVRLGIQVVARGMFPLATLPSEAFDIYNPFVPAGGAEVVRYECPDCFMNGGSGVYSIFVAPEEGQVWKSGSYFVQVQVSIREVTFYDLVEIEIPFIPAG